MAQARIVEYVFFFGILGGTAYLMWQILAPFFAAIAIAAIVVTVSYPFYLEVLAQMPRTNRTLASIVTTFLIGVLVLAPLSFLGYLIFIQAADFYTALSGGEAIALDRISGEVENVVQRFAPGFSLDVTGYIEQGARWVTNNLGAIFAGTLSTIFLLFIAILGIFYFFRDGEGFVKTLIRVSPLPDSEDVHILKKLARSVRSVILGTLSVAGIQGVLTAAGFAVFGISQPILWGAVAAIGALIPGIGTSIVFIPAVAFLALEGSYGAAIGLAAWGMIAVGMVDNLLGPYLMSRGVVLHPFFVLLAVLGGIAFFGPIGLIIGPVVLSLLVVLLELYKAHIQKDEA